jgi:hypothetical protein
MSNRAIHYLRDFHRRLAARHGTDPAVLRFADEASETLGEL